jgi:hypothetical protein
MKKKKTSFPPDFLWDEGESEADNPRFTIKEVQDYWATWKLSLHNHICQTYEFDQDLSFTVKSSI